MKRLIRHGWAVGWASFLTACTLEVMVFAFVDPLALHTLGGDAPEPALMGIYTLAFFAFWGVAAAGCGLTVLLAVQGARRSSTHSR